MHFNRFFSAKAYFKVCIEAHKIWLPFFPYQSLQLSTIVLNDKGTRHSILKMGGIVSNLATLIIV